jgi:hypothetical protein
MIELREVECYTVNLLPKWCELDCDGDRIDYFINNVEKWYTLNFDKNSPMVWCWTYDPDFEYENAGIVAIAFNKAQYADEFKSIFGYVEH